MLVLFENRFASLRVDPAIRGVTYARSAAPFESIDDYDALLRHVVLALVAIDRAHHTLLVDLRKGHLRNEPDFEAVALRFRAEVLRGFARVAVLVVSQVGKLQIQRHAHEKGEHTDVFLDEAAARKFLGW
jgi:hypothetical protein